MAYATSAELKALDGMGEVDITDDMLDEALAEAEALIDAYCGTSFTFKDFTKVLDGNGARHIDLGVLFPRTLTTATVDGEAQVTTGWGLHDEGVLIRDTGVFRTNIVGRNVVISGTAGYSAVPPADIKRACLNIARQLILDSVSRIPDRALSMTNEFGNIMLAQAGGHWRPTSMPEVNAVLNRHRHRAPGR
jgi:hypothetical protein